MSTCLPRRRVHHSRPLVTGSPAGRQNGTSSVHACNGGLTKRRPASRNSTLMRCAPSPCRRSRWSSHRYLRSQPRGPESAPVRVLVRDRSPGCQAGVPPRCESCGRLNTTQTTRAPVDSTQPNLPNLRHGQPGPQGGRPCRGARRTRSRLQVGPGVRRERWRMQRAVSIRGPDSEKTRAYLRSHSERSYLRHHRSSYV